MKRFFANSTIALMVLNSLGMPASAEQPSSQINSKPTAEVNAMTAWTNGLRWNGLRWNGLRWNGLYSQGPEGQFRAEKPVKAKPPMEDTNPFFGLADQPLGE